MLYQESTSARNAGPDGIPNSVPYDILPLLLVFFMRVKWVTRMQCYVKHKQLRFLWRYHSRNAAIICSSSTLWEKSGSKWGRRWLVGNLCTLFAVLLWHRMWKAREIEGGSRNREIIQMEWSYVHGVWAVEGVNGCAFTGIMNMRGILRSNFLTFATYLGLTYTA